MTRVATLGAAILVLAFGQARAQTQERTDAYLIEPGDQLAVSVLEDPGLNTTVLVRPDGRISLPLAGTLQAEGRSPEDLQRAISRALSDDFLTPPTVTVALAGLGGEVELQTVYVLGEVGSPGRYEVELPLDILQALALVGGPTPFAATDRIQVRRRVAGRETVTLFNYEVVEDGLTPSDQIDLSDGDVIVVPQRGLFE